MKRTGLFRSFVELESMVVSDFTFFFPLKVVRVLFASGFALIVFHPFHPQSRSFIILDDCLSEELGKGN